MKNNELAWRKVDRRAVTILWQMFTCSIIVALTNEEILSQAFVFLVGGYETTSALMSFFFYVMATQTEIQEKIYDEIRQELGDVNDSAFSATVILKFSFRRRWPSRNSIGWPILTWSSMKHYECTHRSFGECLSAISQVHSTGKLSDSIVLHPLIINWAIIKYRKDRSSPFLFILFIIILRFGRSLKNSFQNGRTDLWPC